MLLLAVSGSKRWLQAWVPAGVGAASNADAERDLGTLSRRGHLGASLSAALSASGALPSFAAGGKTVEDLLREEDEELEAAEREIEAARGLEEKGGFLKKTIDGILGKAKVLEEKSDDDDDEVIPTLQEELKLKSADFALQQEVQKKTEQLKERERLLTKKLASMPVNDERLKQKADQLDREKQKLREELSKLEDEIAELSQESKLIEEDELRLRRRDRAVRFGAIWKLLRR